MRILTIIAGGLLTMLGVFSVANAGLSFLSLAFLIGIVLILVGIVESFAYRRTIEDEENRHWVLVDGLTTFVLGVVVLTGQLAADIAVPVVFGMWSMISGIRGFVVMTQVDGGTKERERDIDFIWTVVVSSLNLIVGVYTFFNPVLLHLSVLMILGACFIVQGANVIKIGMDIAYSKPDVIKTKEEKIADAEAVAQEARQEIKEAIQKVRDARNAMKEAKEFHEIISEPIGEETEEVTDKEQN